MSNRIIKFRAWHTEMRQMFSAEEMGEDQLTLMPDGRGFVNVSGVSTKLSEFAGERMIPLQFTGLEDQKGKEIYEGDILKTESGICEVKWYDKGACFRWMFQRNSESPLNYDDREVIGNVYQNPELIK